MLRKITDNVICRFVGLVVLIINIPGLPVNLKRWSKWLKLISDMDLGNVQPIIGSKLQWFLFITGSLMLFASPAIKLCERISIFKPKESRKKETKPNPQDLRKRCLDLADDIQKFVKDHNRTFTRFGTETERQENYTMKTLSEFNTEFGEKLDNVYKMLQIYESKNEQLDKLYNKSLKVKDDMWCLSQILKEIAMGIPKYG